MVLGRNARSDWRAHVGLRFQRVHSTHSYGVVLGLIFATFLFAALTPDARWASAVLLLLTSFTFAIALWTSGIARADSRRSIGIVLVSTGLGVSYVITGGSRLEAAVALATAVLTIATIVAIAAGIADQLTVTGRSVMGAVGIYLLLGLVFVFVYGVVAALGSGPFFTQGTDGTRPLRLYFSYVTLATVGYGDYTARDNLGHLLSVVEALIGQIYLVTIVSIVVSQLARRRERG